MLLVLYPIKICGFLKYFKEMLILIKISNPILNPGFIFVI